MNINNIFNLATKIVKKFFKHTVKLLVEDEKSTKN